MHALSGPLAGRETPREHTVLPLHSICAWNAIEINFTCKYTTVRGASIRADVHCRDKPPRYIPGKRICRACTWDTAGDYFFRICLSRAAGRKKSSAVTSLKKKKKMVPRRFLRVYGKFCMWCSRTVLTGFRVQRRLESPARYDVLKTL